MSNSALLNKYLALFEKNQTGLVFAPLAEAYRKLGKRKEAFDVLKKGLRHHPHYALALIVLAHCYFDEGNLEQSYKILSPLAGQEVDNLMLQKLYAQVCYKMYAYKDALQAYKNVLFSNPQDGEAKEKIKELENQEQNYYAYLSKSDQESTLPSQPEATLADTDGWKELDNQAQIPPSINQADEKKVADYLKDLSVSQVEEWKIKQWSVPELNETKAVPTTEVSENINLDSYHDISSNDEVPIVTHTLIDIFCAQKHYDKALVLLEKVLKKNPQDHRSRQKYDEVNQLLGKTKVAPVEVPPQTPMPKKDHDWDESKYHLLANKYGAFLSHLKASGKST